MAVPMINTVVFDCADAERLVAFWTALLGVGERHRSPGFVWLEPQRDGGFSLAFQEVPDPTPGKNKLHLDGEYPDLDRLTARVEALGGSVVDRQSVTGFVWNVYADPEGNVFCVGHAA